LCSVEFPFLHCAQSHFSDWNFILFYSIERKANNLEINKAAESKKQTNNQEKEKNLEMYCFVAGK